MDSPMNTANLQLEGLLLALSSLLSAMERKGLLTRQEIDDALGHAEANARTDPRRPSELSAAHVDAICFPIRFLQLAATRAADQPQSFAELTAVVGQTKPDH
jgi:hypothetical protein